MSDELTAIETALADAATSPQAASVDGRSATSRSVDDLIKLRNYQATKDAVDAGPPAGFGLRFQKIKPPGAG